MKGSASRPFDGYQKEAIDILNANKVRYYSYDVMGDPDLREILKEVSRFNSYPQLFVEQKFIGGLNFIRNANEHGGLAVAIPSTEVMLPMKEKI